MPIAIGLLKTLLELARGSRSGVLDAEGPGAKVRLFLENGAIVNAVEGTVGETLGRILVREKVIDEDQYAAAIEWTADVRSQGKSSKIGEVFVELGMLTPDQLNAALSAQVRQKVVRALTWSSSTATFVEAHGDLVVGDDAARYPTSLEPLVVAALRQAEPDAIDELLEQAHERYPQLRSDPESHIEERVTALSLRPAEEAFVRKIDGTRTVTQLLGTTAPVDPAVLLAALLLTDCLDLHATVQGSPTVESSSAFDVRGERPRTRLRTRSSRPPPPLPSGGPAMPKVIRKPASVFPPGAESKRDIKQVASRLKAAHAAKKALPLPRAAKVTPQVDGKPIEPGAEVSRLLAEKAFQAGRRLLRANQTAMAAAELARAATLFPTAEYELWATWTALRTTSADEPSLVAKLHDAAERTLDLDASVGFAWFVLSWLARRSGEVERANALYMRARTLDAQAVDEARDVRLRPADPGAQATRGEVRPLAPPLGSAPRLEAAPRKPTPRPVTAPTRVVSPRAMSEAPPPASAPAGPTSFEVAPTALAAPLKHAAADEEPTIRRVGAAALVAAAGATRHTPAGGFEKVADATIPKAPPTGLPAPEPLPKPTPPPRPAASARSLRAPTPPLGTAAQSASPPASPSGAPPASPSGAPLAKVALTKTAVMVQSPIALPQKSAPEKPKPRSATPLGTKPPSRPSLGSALASTVAGHTLPKVDDDDVSGFEPTALVPITSGAAALAATPVPPRAGSSNPAPASPFASTVALAATPEARKEEVDDPEVTSGTARRFEWSDLNPPVLASPPEPPKPEAPRTKTAPMAQQPMRTPPPAPAPPAPPTPAPAPPALTSTLVTPPPARAPAQAAAPPPIAPRPQPPAVAPQPPRYTPPPAREATRSFADAVVPQPRKSNGGFLIAVSALCVAAGVVAFLLFRTTTQDPVVTTDAAAPMAVASVAATTSTTSATPPARSVPAVTSTTSALASASATPSATVTVATSASASPSASASSSAVASAAPSSEPAEDTRPIGAGQGMLVLPKGANGHRVWVDERMIGTPPPSPIIACGHRTVKVGSMGREQEIDVPCGGKIAVPYP